MIFQIESRKYGLKNVSVSDADWEDVRKHRWFLTKCSSQLYVAAKIKVDGKGKNIYLHRFLTVTPYHVDHIDGDPLNNVRENLRPVSRTQNNQNSRKRSKFSSRYKGVYWNKTNRKWIAEICVDGKGRYLGSFSKEIDAARAYDTAAKDNYGEYAAVN